jgi:hypothetical protein
MHLDADQGKQFFPEAVGEDNVLVTNNGARDAVESDHCVKEDLGHSHHGIQMPQW